MGESTTQTPPDKLPRYIPDRDKLCLSKEQAEHVYEAVENGEQVKPLSVNSGVDEQDSIVNPYTIGLGTNTDSSLKKEPALEMKKCDLTWSILSTVVDYTECGKSSPYKEVNYSPVYSKFTSTKEFMMKQQITGKRGMKMYHVICMPEMSLMTIMMSVQPIWDITIPRERKELFL